MEIIRAGSKPSVKGPEAWFTGTVRIDPLMNPFDAARVQGSTLRACRARRSPSSLPRAPRGTPIRLDRR